MCVCWRAPLRRAPDVSESFPWGPVTAECRRHVSALPCASRPACTPACIASLLLLMRTRSSEIFRNLGKSWTGQWIPDRVQSHHDINIPSAHEKKATGPISAGRLKPPEALMIAQRSRPMTCRKNKTSRSSTSLIQAGEGWKSDRLVARALPHTMSSESALSSLTADE